MEPSNIFEWLVNALHSLPVGVVYVLCAALLTLGFIMATKAVRGAAKKVTAFIDRLDATMDKVDKGMARGEAISKTVEDLHDIQAVQAENHLTTIQNEAIKQTALLVDMKIGQAVVESKFDTLIEVISKKL